MTNRLHAVMAGSGNPRAVMTERRKMILMKLHQGVPMDRIATQLGLSEAALLTEFQALLDTSLLVQQQNEYRPNFFIATADEVQRVVAHAGQFGPRLADELGERWETLETLYGRLVLSKHSPFQVQAMLLVGDRMLDVGSLYALMDDADLMPPASHRPAPDSPDAHYYYWMIEGQADQLGKYGQNQMSLPWPNWALITFGQYWIEGQPNVERNHLHERAAIFMQQVDSPQALAAQLEVRVIDPQDSQLWTADIQPPIRALIEVYQEQRPTFRQLYEAMGASRYLANGFPEFFCWYFHVAYAAAIDGLIQRGYMDFPSERFVSTIWHEAED